MENDPEKNVEALSEYKPDQKVWIQILTRNNARWHPAVIAGVYSVPDLLSPMIHFTTVRMSPTFARDDYADSKDYFFEEDSIVIRPRDTY